MCPTRFFLFRPTIKIKGSSLKKQANELGDKHGILQTYCFCCYVIKSAGEAANKVLLSVVWNPLPIEINLSQIRALDINARKYVRCARNFYCVGAWGRVGWHHDAQYGGHMASHPSWPCVGHELSSLTLNQNNLFTSKILTLEYI